MKNLFVLLTMAFWPMLASAQAGVNELRISDIQAEAGQQVKLSVELVNENPVRGIGAYLYLPEGVTMEEINIIPNRWPEPDEWIDFQYKKLEDGVYKFVVIAMEKINALSEGEGEIFTITLNVGKDVADGVYEIMLKNVEMSVWPKDDAYLQMGGSYTVTQTIGKASLEIKGRGDATGISNVPSAIRENAGIYDLMGRRLKTAPQKGVYIQGKKKIAKH
jgi:hypothetical protein